MYELKNKEFKKAYDEICNFHSRLTVFSDFVKMCAISIYNSFANNETLEKEYLRTINSYNKKEQELFVKMFGELIMMYEESKEIVDILGPIYMNISSKDRSLGQVFTPEHIADFMVRMSIEDNKENFEKSIKENGFISMCEPACGSGIMIISLAKVLKAKGINYQENLLVKANDISDVCVYMTYIQLALYGIPAIVYCGNTLTNEIKFKMETPLYFLQYWKFRNSIIKKSENTLNSKQNEIIVDETMQNKFKEIMVKGNCQISLF